MENDRFSFYELSRQIAICSAVAALLGLLLQIQPRTLALGLMVNALCYLVTMPWRDRKLHLEIWYVAAASLSVAGFVYLYVWFN